MMNTALAIPGKSGVGVEDIGVSKALWENVVIEGMPPKDPIKPAVLKSWIRCREMGLDPFEPAKTGTLSKKQLHKLLRKNRDLIDICTPVIDMIEIAVRGTGFIISLCDSRCYVLVFRGSKDMEKMAATTHFKPGCLRSTEYAGTTAMSLALDEGRPFQVTGLEHYKLRNHQWTGSAAPIFDSTGNIVAVLCLSGHRSARHKHTLALVTSTAQYIESQLREKALAKEMQRLHLQLASVFDSISDGVIAIDSHLNITEINNTAAQMFGMEHTSLLGRGLEETLQPSDSLTQAIMTKNPSRGIEVVFKCPSGKKVLLCRVDSTLDASGHIVGSIVTLTRRQQVVQMGKNIWGNHAKFEFSDIVGKNKELVKQIDLAKMAARADSRVLVSGESGTGKEIFAHAIHCYSARRNGPFVALSCASIPGELIESELFGYKGGAFTGARREGMTGKLELADQGTLFLDEVNSLPLDLQAKFLRVLQENEIVRLGDHRVIPIDIRVIAATNQDLAQLVEQGDFREDLFYRLNVVEIAIPPLRDRTEDIEMLVSHILNRICKRLHFKKPEVTNEALDVLKNYPWPGNVRQMQNCLERALLLSEGEALKEKHFIMKSPRTRRIMNKESKSLHQGYKEIIEDTVNRCRGNISRAARELKIARSTLYRKMREFDLL